MNNSRSIILLIFVLITPFVSVLLGGVFVAANESEESTLVDFQYWTDRKNWRIVNDDVMGGISTSTISFTKTGTAVFKGDVSLENNGGFASVRIGPRPFKLGDASGLVIRLKGDGKKYQIRVRESEMFDGISYRHLFVTRTDIWETIRVPFSTFVPVFRGRVLTDKPLVSPAKIKQIGFLIAGKQAGPFRLEIDWIKTYN